MSENDVHRREIVLALARPDVTVIPVVVDGATMPKPDQLPQNIRDLIPQQSLAISDSAAHRKVDLDGLMADIRRVGRFEPKPVSTSTLTPTPPLAPIKNSVKVIAALCLLALIFFAAIAEEEMDHDTKVGGTLFGAIALWLAVSGFKDIKAGRVKGRGRAIAAMGLSGLATLGMFGALTLVEPAVAPIADTMGPSAAIIAPQPSPMQTPTAPPGFSKPILIRKINLDSLDAQFAELLRPLVE